MKRIVYLFCILFSIVILTGCSNSSEADNSNADADQATDKAILGTWQGSSDDQTITLTFEDKDSYEVEIVSDSESIEIDGDYDLYNGNLTFIPNSVNGDDEETYVSKNNLKEKDLSDDNYIFNDTDATFTINGNTLSLTVNDQTIDFTKID